MDFIITATGQLIPEQDVVRARTHQGRTSMIYGNPKYHNEHGQCCTDEHGDFIKDAENNLIPADPRTGAPKVETERCPTCKGSGKVVKK